MSYKFPYFAKNEGQWVQIVKPRETIMGNWVLVRNEDGFEWFVPLPDLVTNAPEAERTTHDS